MDNATGAILGFVGKKEDWVSERTFDTVSKT